MKLLENRKRYNGHYILVIKVIVFCKKNLSLQVKTVRNYWPTQYIRDKNACTFTTILKKIAYFREMHNFVNRSSLASDLSRGIRENENNALSPLSAAAAALCCNVRLVCVKSHRLSRRKYQPINLSREKRRRKNEREREGGRATERVQKCASSRL